MICSICNCRLASEDTHTIVIANGIDCRKYIYNRFNLCPGCYSDFKYRLAVTRTPIEGPEDRDDIKWPDDAEWDRTHPAHSHDTEWDRTHPAPEYKRNNPDD